MKQEYKCAECGKKIIVEGPADSMPTEPLLCQICDPEFASLKDNKHHKGFAGQGNALYPTVESMVIETATWVVWLGLIRFNGFHPHDNTEFESTDEIEKSVVLNAIEAGTLR